MSEEHAGLCKFIVPLLIATAVVLVPWGLFAYRELRATARARSLKVGDSFSVRMVTKNPYDSGFVFGGRITATNGVYVQYVTGDGDTASTNIRDCFLFPGTCQISVCGK